MTFPLIAAAQANAQSRNGSDPAIVGPMQIPSAVDQVAAARHEAGRMPALTPLLDPEGLTQLPDGIVGSMAVAPNLDIRLGMLRVLPTRPGERALARSHPLRDVAGRHDRVAAAGLKLSF